MLPVPKSDLEHALPAFLVQQRWYRAKAKNILELRVADVIALDPGTWLVVAHIRYQDGESAHYLLPLAQSGSGAPVLSGLHDGLQSAEFRQSLLDAIAGERAFQGEQGEFGATRTSAFSSDPGAPEKIESSVSRAEQSNSSIIFGSKYILKLFRKVEPGINPDIEVGVFLTEHGFANTPAVLGALEYRPANAEAMQAGILMRFVPNQGDAWKYTLQSLEQFFKQAQGNAPALPASHPLESTVDGAAGQVGPYLESARLLGRRTAEMHRALSDPSGGPEFAPEPFTAEAAALLAEELCQQADITFDLLRDKQRMLPGEAGADAARLLELESEVRGRLGALKQNDIAAVRIRHHGDYHLGQVLWTGSDFMIIDFEGEPARPLADRRRKTFAMRDVAGMVRSFSYAAYAAIPKDAADAEQAERWADFWTAIISSEYLAAYFEAAGGAPFAASNRQEHKLLFDAFILQKALYEVAYELNNRPDWVRIPLRGILNLVGESSRRTQFA